MRALVTAVWTWVVGLWRCASAPVVLSEEDEYWEQHYWQAW